MTLIRRECIFLLITLLTLPVTGFAQVSATEINGWRNSVADGTITDTNVTFTLGMRLTGEEIFRDTATLGQDVTITATIRPEAADIGAQADVIIVDYIPPFDLKMRNVDGNFVAWNGSLRTLEPYLEGVTLTGELDAEVFSGQLGAAGDHRIFVGFLVGEVLYFTPSALRISITEEAGGPSAREQAISLFESTISPNVVQFRCIQCHVSGGQADGQAMHIFVRTSNPDHLAINFQEFEELHAATSTTYILSKVQGLNHGGNTIFTPSSSQYQSLQEFLGLLDQAATE